MAFTLFRRTKQIKIIAGGSETIGGDSPTSAAPAKRLKIAVASETKYRKTEKRTLFLGLDFQAAIGPFQFTITKNGNVVDFFSRPIANDVVHEHALLTGDYAIEVQDAAGMKSERKTFSVQGANADLTLLSVEQYVDLSFLVDSGRGNLSPYTVNVFSSNGEYLNSLQGQNPNPIQVKHALAAGNYYFQVVDNMGYWSNMVRFTIENRGLDSTETSGSSIDVGINLPILNGGIFGDTTIVASNAFIKPRIIQKGRIADLEPIIKGVSENWTISDNSKKDLPNGYSWHYWIGNHRVITKSPLEGYKLEHNAPFQITKMGIRDGVQKYREWAEPAQFNDRAAGLFFDHGDTGSCVTVAFL